MRRITAGATVAVTALALSALPAAGATSPSDTGPPHDAGPTTASAGTPGPPAAGAPAGTAPTTVTLLTGDRVTVAPAPENPARLTVTAVDAASRPGGEPVSFRRSVIGGRPVVIPSDVAALVPDRLDTSLFDVGALAAVQATGADGGAGYRSLPRVTTPVIVRDAGSLPGAPNARTLESIGARAGQLAPAHGPARPAGTAGGTSSPAGTHTQDESGARGPGAAGRDPARTPASSDTRALLRALADEPRPGTRRHDGSGPKVWLDAPVEAALDESAPQVGAPAAWEAGFTGDGVTVAVLDSGYDAGHPDLDGAVTGERDFTDDGDTIDTFGHGTHVASILAGRAAASDGRYRGIAPDADLLVAKVLDNSGTGLVSWSIDALEWAGDQGAEVVNMSLGQPLVHTDGTDPASLAVDAASEKHDMLVVVAAGNDGPGRETVTPPGTATSALTVGSVTKQDQIDNYSSRGPRFGDHAIKPEMTAPGVAILAAMAVGTEYSGFGNPVGDGYHTVASGTSMATPHVAGAAAVLLQQRPDLTAQQLKALLMTSAQDVGRVTTWQEGAGRLRMPRAVKQEILASPGALSFGLQRWPQEGPVARTLTYTNPGDADVPLDLAATIKSDDGEPVPDGLLALGADRVTVPAGGTASVEVVADASLTDGGLFSGKVTATAPDGERLRTVVGLSDEVESYDLRIEGIGRDGAPAGPDDAATVAGLDEGARFRDFPWFPEDGVLEYRVPAGTYYAGAFIQDGGADGGGSGSAEGGAVTAAIAPEVVVDRDTTIALDARDGVPARVDTHRQTEPESGAMAVSRRSDGVPVDEGFTVRPEQAAYAVPTPQVGTGTFQFRTEHHLIDPSGPASYWYDLVHVYDGGVPDDLTRRAGPRTTARVMLDHRAFVPGQQVTSSVSAWLPLIGRWETARTVTAPKRVTQYLSADAPVRWSHAVTPALAEGPEFVPLLASDPRAYAAGERVRQVLLGQIHHTGFATDTVPAGASVSRWDDELSVWLPPWVDDAGHDQEESTDPVTTTRLRLWRDGELVEDETEFPSVWTKVPDADAEYRLRLDMTREAEWWPMSTEVHADWTFRSAAPGHDDPVALPLLELGYDVGLDELNRGEREERIRITATHQELSDGGGEIAGLDAWWSVDDGGTWRPARVRDRGDGSYDAVVEVPADATGHVSLRTEARDDAGSRVEETILRAYALAH